MIQVDYERKLCHVGFYDLREFAYEFVSYDGYVVEQLGVHEYRED